MGYLASYLAYTDLNLNCRYFDVHEFVNKFKNNASHPLLNINIQSLPSKFEELEELIESLFANK